MFGYLSEFWDSITAETSETIAWFQSVGNAVAGAIGKVLLMPLQVVVDFGLASGWIISNIGQIIFSLLAPFKFIAIFFSSFISSISTMPSANNLFTQNTQALGFLQSFPLWSQMSIILGGLVLILGVITTIKVSNL